MLPSETMIWQPEFTDKTLSKKTGAVHYDACTTVWVKGVTPLHYANKFPF
ncbi:PapI protein [Escherichia coli]|nr:PapI protein [Escherichia coli]